MITDNLRMDFWHDLINGGLGDQDFVLGDNGEDFFVYCTKEEIVKKIPTSFDGCNVHAILSGPFFPATA